ncbi:hypothetical protein [Aliikangiella sp. IMCC44359]|uniref:hypothetical protein n=1 Tax=Aliikangiella sp. IMCC44359 TaxID=3459125 RepID=UPI00403AA12D
MAQALLTMQQQRKVEKLIRSWTTKLTWELLVSRIFAEYEIEITRQALSTYKGVKNEYALKKVELRGASPKLKKAVTISDINLYSENARLKSEINRLEEVNARQLRTIERICANAQSIPNLDLNELFVPLPEEAQ